MVEIEMTQLTKRNRAELSMLLIAFIWGTTFVVVKNALQDIRPFIFLGLRFILAFGALAALLPKEVVKINLRTLVYGILLGFFLLIGYVFQTLGLKYTTASNAGFITGLSVVLVPIIYALLNRCWPSLRTIVTVATASVGLFLLSFQGGATVRLSLGDSLVLICAFGFAFHIVFVDRYSHEHNPAAITAVQILFVGLSCLAISLYIEPHPAYISPRAATSILVTAIFATSLAFFIQNIMQKYSTPTRFAIVLTSEPFFAAVTAYYWAGEILTRQALGGGALIILSMLISIVVRKEKNLVEANV